MGTVAGIDGRATEEMTDRLLPRNNRYNRCQSSRRGAAPGDQIESIRGGRVTGPNSRVTGPRWPCYSGSAKALKHTTCVQEKSNRATGPHIDIVSAALLVVATRVGLAT